MLTKGSGQVRLSVNQNRSGEPVAFGHYLAVTIIFMIHSGVIL